MTKKFDTYLQVFVTHDVRLRLVAIAYLTGNKGMFSRPVKTFIEEGINRYLETLTPKQKKEYDEILANVMVMESQLGKDFRRKHVAEVNRAKKEVENRIDPFALVNKMPEMPTLEELLSPNDGSKDPA